MTTTHPRAGVRTNYVYELYAENGACLYVGRTALLGTRLDQHGSKPYWLDVARIEVTAFPDYDAAKEAERARIQDLNPVHNKEHTDRFTRGETRKANREARHARGELCPPHLRCRFCRESSAA